MEGGPERGQSGLKNIKRALNKCGVGRGEQDGERETNETNT